MLDNGGPLLDDDASDPKMRWVKVSPHELLEGIAELNMEERGYYMTMFFTMYARMGGMPFDEREGAKILRVDIRMYRRLRDRMVALGKLHVDDGELKNARTEYEITEYARKIRRLKDAAAERVAKRREQVSLTRKLAKVAEDIRQTSPELPGDFSQTSPELLPEVPGSSGQKASKINGCGAQKLREQEQEQEQDTRKKDTKQRSSQTPAAAAPSLDELENKLLAACNGALANPCNSQGLLSLAVPQMWLSHGADLDLDVIPTLRAVGKRDHGKGISSWSYFTKAVADAVARRKAAVMPEGYAGKQQRAAPGQASPSSESVEDYKRRMMAGLRRGD
jgi:uncharacterized protein YdaU (DUF1376 family)